MKTKLIYYPKAYTDIKTNSVCIGIAYETPKQRPESYQFDMVEENKIPCIGSGQTMAEAKKAAIQYLETTIKAVKRLK